MASNVIHVWKPLEQQTWCGLWFKSIPATQKPNVVSLRLALYLYGVCLNMCQNCERDLYSKQLNNKGEQEK